MPEHEASMLEQCSPHAMTGTVTVRETVKGEKKESDARATRLPDDWKPDEGLRVFTKGLGLDPDVVHSGFVDYWKGAPGAKGRKQDWPATWRNWCRREAERKTLANGHANGHRPQTPARMGPKQPAYGTPEWHKAMKDAGA